MVEALFASSFRFGVEKKLMVRRIFSTGKLPSAKIMWSYSIAFDAVLFVAGLLCRGDQVKEYRYKMETLMNEGKYADALTVGDKTLRTDSSLTMLRIACMHRCNNMGSKLFSYPLVGGSKAMLPNGTSVTTLHWTPPVWMSSKSGNYILPVDYQLCGLLLDKQLDKFVTEVRQQYKLDSIHLAKHYQEALVLYTHRRATPKIVYHNAVIETDFRDYQAMAQRYADPRERQTALRDTYGNTYWYYFQYCEY